VERLERSLFAQFGSALSAAYGLDNPECDQAEPAIHDQTQVDPERHMPRSQRQVGYQQKVSRISCQDGNQGVDEVRH
jgi:hypothetical protein